MAQVRGINTVMALGEESTYGTAATGNFVKIFFCRESLTASRNLIDSCSLGAGRVRSAPISGNWDVSGEIMTEINAESMLYLLKHGLDGAPAKTGSAAPYTFTYEPADLPTGATLEIDYGSDISGAGRVKQLVGCKVGGFTLDFPNEGIPSATWRIVGAKPTVPAPSALTDSTPATISTHQPFSAFQASITEGGSPIATITSLNVTVDNGIEAVFAIGGAGARVSAPEGFATVTGQIEAIFSSAGLLNKAINATESDIEITLTRGAGTGASVGNEKLVITLEELLYEPAFPAVEGPAGLLVRLPFKCYKGTADNAIKVVATIPTDVSSIPAT